MSATASLLNVCPNLQGDLDANWLNCHSQAERTPFLEYLLSGENKQPVTMTVVPGEGKVRTFELRYQQRENVDTILSNQPVTVCSGGDKVGDSLYTVDMDTNVNRQELLQYDIQDFIRNCESQPQWLAKQIERKLDKIRRAIWRKEALALAPLVGSWSSDSEDSDGTLIALNADMEVKTLKDGTTDEVFPFTWEQIDMNLMKTGFCDQTVIFGSSKLWEYTRRVQAGCCANQGVDLRAIYQSYNRAVIWDREVQDALGDSDNAAAVQKGALQLLNFSLFEGMAPVSGGNYFRQMIIDPATGMKVDMVMSDNCGRVTIALTATTKLIALPTDMFSAGDVYEGVNYVTGLVVTNV